MHDLEEALTLRSAGEARWLAYADPRYEANTGMFGGWTAAVLLRAVMDDPNRQGKPSAITVNYVARVQPESDVAIQTRELGGGRSLHHWQAEMVGDDDAVFAHAMLIFADRRATDGYTEPRMPEVPSPEQLDEFHPPGPHGERSVHRPISGNPPFAQDTTVSMAWVRDTTGRVVDHLQLALLADSYAPRCFFWSEGPRPSSSMTLSVYFHATDQEVKAIGDDYVLNEATATRGETSTCGQQARLWSKQGSLLVTTEQLCWYR